MCCDADEIIYNFIFKLVQTFTQGPMAMRTKRKLSLRTFLYTAAVIMQIVWTLPLVLHIGGHFPYLLKLDTRNHSSESKSAEEISKGVMNVAVILGELSLLFVTMLFILPPLLPSPRARLKSFIAINVIISLVTFLYAIICSTHGIGVLLTHHLTKLKIEEIEINVSIFAAAITTAFASTFLAVYSYRKQIHSRRRSKLEAFLSHQGKVHGAELLLIAGALIIAGSAEHYYHPELTKGFIRDSMPPFILSLILGVQLRHYTFAHGSHLVPAKARARSRQFLQQYKMDPLDREVTNSDDFCTFFLKFCCTVTIYPRVSCPKFF